MIFHMKLWATNEVRVNSKLWYFIASWALNYYASRSSKYERMKKFSSLTFKLFTKTRIIMEIQRSHTSNIEGQAQFLLSVIAVKNHLREEAKIGLRVNVNGSKKIGWMERL